LKLAFRYSVRSLYYRWRFVQIYSGAGLSSRSFPGVIPLAIIEPVEDTLSLLHHRKFHYPGLQRERTGILYGHAGCQMG
jgi:hypothetical protein